MKSILIAFAAIVCIGTSCERKAVVENTHYSDTLQAPLPIGIYSGVLPCADCKGIKYDLQLDDNFQYISKQQYIGKSEKIITNKGHWIMLSDTIIKLDAKQKKDDRYFSIQKNALHGLDKNGDWIVAANDEEYTLRKQSVAETIVIGEDKVLYGTWELTTIGTTKTTKEDYPSGFPYIELKEQTAAGFSGCNRFTGSYTTDVKTSALKFGLMGGTKMACPEMDRESAFLAALSNTASYRITASTLLLLDKNKKKLAAFRVLK